MMCPLLERLSARKFEPWKLLMQPASSAPRSCPTPPRYAYPEADQGDAKLARFGVFGTTLVAFSLAEMDDKTQVATVALVSVLGSEPAARNIRWHPGVCDHVSTALAPHATAVTAAE
jgi:hypothetical protein